MQQLRKARTGENCHDRKVQEHMRSNYNKYTKQYITKKGYTSDYPTRKKRIETEKDWTHKDGWWFKPPGEGDPNPRWYNPTALTRWTRNIAHECTPGEYRSISLVKYKGKKRISLNGYCTGCRAKLPEYIKTIIFLKENV